MLESLLGNFTVEKTLFYISVYGEGYAKKMSDTFTIPLNGIQQQLKRLEDGSILVSRLVGKTRLYQFNPRYPMLNELKTLLSRAIDLLPDAQIEQYYRKCARPRRKGKKL